MGINWVVFEQSCQKRSTFLRKKFPKFANFPQKKVGLFPTEDENESLFFQKEGMISRIDYHLLFFYVICLGYIM